MKAKPTFKHHIPSTKFQTFEQGGYVDLAMMAEKIFLN